MDKRVVTEIKKIIQHVEAQNKNAFYLIWKEDGYSVSLQKKTKAAIEDEPFSISSTSGEYIVENIRSLDNSFKILDLVKELENEGIYWRWDPSALKG
jgi:hypothetical protein